MYFRALVPSIVFIALPIHIFALKGASINAIKCLYLVIAYLSLHLSKPSPFSASLVPFFGTILRIPRGLSARQASIEITSYMIHPIILVMIGITSMTIALRKYPLDLTISSWNRWNPSLLLLFIMIFTCHFCLFFSLPTIIALELLLVIFEKCLDQINMTGLILSLLISAVISPQSSFPFLYIFELEGLESLSSTKEIINKNGYFSTGRIWISEIFANVMIITCWLVLSYQSNLFIKRSTMASESDNKGKKSNQSRRDSIEKLENGENLIPIKKERNRGSNDNGKSLEKGITYLILFCFIILSTIYSFNPELIGESLAITAILMFAALFSFDCLSVEDLHALPWSLIYSCQSSLTLGYLVESSGLLEYAIKYPTLLFLFTMFVLSNRQNALSNVILILPLFKKWKHDYANLPYLVMLLCSSGLDGMGTLIFSRLKVINVGNVYNRNHSHDYNHDNDNDTLTFNRLEYEKDIGALQLFYWVYIIMFILVLYYYRDYLNINAH